MSKRSETIHAAVAREVAAARPASILAIGTDAAALLPPLDPAVRVKALADSCAIDAIHADWRFDLAIVAGALEHRPKRDAQMLLARLRDVNARTVLLAVDQPRAATHGWSRNDLLALGMQRVTGVHAPIDLFVFDIRRYKTTPDWLNARYWANPQMWDKFRW